MDTKDLLRRAQHEIEDLRRQNEVLRARVDTMDFLALVLNTKPAYQSVAMAEDIVPRLREAIHNLEIDEQRQAAE